MPFVFWYTILGLLLIAVAVSATLLRRLPITTTLLYFGVGLAMSPWGLGLLRLDPVGHPVLIERLTELAVLISLFTAGLKLRLPLSDRRWQAPLQLASIGMVITVGLIALAGVYGLGLSWGASVLLGAVLAPTDPVVADDVQVRSVRDTDRLRFALTGEAGLNDGTAFPFVMLGLGLMGLHDLGEGGWRWWLIDLTWAVTVGLTVGAVAGFLVGRIVLYLRRTHREAIGTDDFLALGLIGVSYGVAHHVGGWGFLAVFAAGLALRQVERREEERTLHASSADSSLVMDRTNADPIRPHARPAPDEAPLTEPDLPEPDPQEVGTAAELDLEVHPLTPDLEATLPDAIVEEAKRVHPAADPTTAPRYMASAVLGFNEQLERIGQVTLVVLLGGMLPVVRPPAELIWFIPLLFLVIRPTAVMFGLLGTGVGWIQTVLAGWFGIRGVGSLYYLAYAIAHGLDDPPARLMMSVVLWTITASVVVHGLTANLLMAWYKRQPESEPMPGRPVPHPGSG